jgi:hypothetical protein
LFKEGWENEFPQTPIFFLIGSRAGLRPRHAEKEGR